MVRPEVLREFLGSPKGNRWAALLKAAGVTVSRKREPGRPNRGLTRAQCVAVMRVRYADVGAHRLKRWKVG